MKTAAQELLDAVAMMDWFHFVRLAGDALDRCRAHVQQVKAGHGGRAGDSPYKGLRTLRSGASLLSEKQKARGSRQCL